MQETKALRADYAKLDLATSNFAKPGNQGSGMGQQGSNMGQGQQGSGMGQGQQGRGNGQSSGQQQGSQSGR